jgi:phytoene synthase
VALCAWRLSLRSALAGAIDEPLLPALIDTVRSCRIPVDYLHAAIDGVEMDLDQRCYGTFAELEQYCYRVGSAVGLACIHIWGFRSAAALAPARQCGIAFQLTNILRDLKEDADRGRVYLPTEDLRRFEYSVDDLRRGVRDERLRALLWFEIERAENFYRQAAELDRWLQPDARRIFAAMMATYRALLTEIKRLDLDVLLARARLSPWRKLHIAASSLLRRQSYTAAAKRAKQRETVA